jgi:hypothetical protein
MVKLPSRKNYFAKSSNKYSSPFVKQLITGKRFNEITKYLHFRDTLDPRISAAQMKENIKKLIV